MSPDEEELLRGWHPEIRTDRFTLRSLNSGDAPEVLAIHSRLDVVRWLGNPPFRLMADLPEAHARIDSYLTAERDDPRLVVRAIVPHETGRMVGAVLIARCILLDGSFAGEYQLGWHLHPDANGHGYASEAARLLADQAFTAGHAELVIGMYPDNHASAAVALRLGAEDHGVGPDPWYGGDGRQFRLRSEHLAHVETERLVLRRFTRHDLDMLTELFSRPEVAAWSGPRRPLTRQEVRERLAQQSGRAGPHPAMAVLAVCTKASDRPIGQVMLGPLPSSGGQDRQEVEIGWHLFPEDQGHGYATEAARALLARAASGGIEEVFAVTAPKNTASQAVCARLGMTDLGLRDDWYDTTVRAFHLSTS